MYHHGVMVAGGGGDGAAPRAGGRQLLLGHRVRGGRGAGLPVERARLPVESARLPVESATNSALVTLVTGSHDISVQLDWSTKTCTGLTMSFHKRGSMAFWLLLDHSFDGVKKLH